MDEWKFHVELEYIDITNFRIFKESQRITFDTKLTVLIGNNGAGKTTVLDATASLLKVFVGYIKNKEFNNSQVDYIRQQDIHNGTIEAVNYTDVRINDFYNLSWSSTLTKEGYEADTVSEAVEFDKLRELIDRMNDILREEKKVNLPIMAYYPCSAATSSVDNEIKQGLKVDIFDAYDKALTYDSFGIKNFIEWYKWQESIENKKKAELLNFIFKNNNKYLNNTLFDELINKSQNSILQIVQKAILSILNDGGNEIYEDLNIDFDNSEQPLRVRKNGEFVYVNQMSSGEKTILALVADLARRLAIANPLLENPLHGNGIVLIDEIDLHLHPRWQRAILPKLMAIFPNIQWVVTTHSPQILGEIKEGSIYILENAKIELLKFNTYGKDMNRILERIMGVAERNEEVEQLFDEYFELIEKNQLETAAQKRSELENLVGKDEPLFSRADGIIRRKQLIGR